MPDKKPNPYDDKRDAVEALLQDKYMLSPEESKVYAERVRGKANAGGSDEFGLVGEALTNRADIERQRMDRMNYYVWLMKKAHNREHLEPHETDYINQVNERTRQFIQQRAQKEIEDQRKTDLAVANEGMRRETALSRISDDIAGDPAVGPNPVIKEMQSKGQKYYAVYKGRKQ